MTRKHGYINRVCENPDCMKKFVTPYHRQVYCCEACRKAVKRTAKLPKPEPVIHISKLDDMTPNELLYYGKIQAQNTLESIKKQKEKR